MAERVTDKRSAILAATLRLISENGFHGTAMSKVAQEAGVSAGIIYHYFASKDELMDELYKEIKRNFGSSLADCLERDQPLRIQIHQMLGAMIRYYIRRPLESAFLEQYSRSPYHRPEIELETAQFYVPLIELFERAKEEMIIKPLPDPVVLAFTLDVATSLAQRHAAGFLDLTDELIEEVIDASWAAIRL
jgi:AcrR family transcriptional regulator